MHVLLCCINSIDLLWLGFFTGSVHSLEVAAVGSASKSLLPFSFPCFPVLPSLPSSLPFFFLFNPINYLITPSVPPSLPPSFVPYCLLGTGRIHVSGTIHGTGTINVSLSSNRISPRRGDKQESRQIYCRVSS